HHPAAARRRLEDVPVPGGVRGGHAAVPAAAPVRAADADHDRGPGPGDARGRGTAAGAADPGDPRHQPVRRGVDDLFYTAAMRTVAVTAPDGTEWAVRVAWQPRWPLLVRRFGGWRAKRREKKKRGSGADVGDAANGLANIGFEMPDDIVAALLVIVGLLLF